MFLFNRSFAAALAGLAVALLFVCFDRACQVPAGDENLPPVAAAVPVVTAPAAAAGIAIPTSTACPPPGACGTLRAGS